MEEILEFFIDGNREEVKVGDTTPFLFGKDEFLSGKDTDLTYNQDWYERGYTEVKFLSDEEFNDLKNGLIVSIGKIIKEELSIDVEGFNLQNYHEFVKSDEDHFKVISRTRDLYPENFNFPITDLYPRLSKILGFELTDYDPREKQGIIVRINRPHSKDFNPPHKDIYQGVDEEDSWIPQLVNFWIPIAGVTEKSSLPMAPRSHLINENKVLRTFDGAYVEGKKYSVRTVKSWNSENSFERSKVKEGEVLIFSSHLIHGLASNHENNLTRVALEFRLFKAQ